jgi:putative spermidine/putrescine transport system substrate-binding protein
MLRRLLLLLTCFLTLAGAAGAEDGIDAMTHAEMLEAARGTEVRWHMWGGSDQINAWVDGYVTEEAKKRFGITLVRVPMDAAVFINKLLTEKAAGRETGTMDLLWINGENFRNARQAGLLYGPLLDRMPAFRAFYDPEQSRYDFGFPVEGFEAPYGRAQFVFEYDSARMKNPPRNYAELKAWILANPGRFTYPQPPDFTGSAFIRQIFYVATGGHAQYMGGLDRDLYAAKSPAAWAWLNEIRPALWREGRTYPKDAAALDTLFARGEIDMCMSYHPAHAQMKILEKTYPDTVRTFVLEEGTISNTHFTAVPFNAPNKAGAMVLADFLMSPDAQLSKYLPENWGDLPALDVTRLPEETARAFAAVDLGAATLSAGELSGAAVPEIPSAYLELLEKDWETQVLDQ